MINIFHFALIHQAQARMKKKVQVRKNLIKLLNNYSQIYKKEKLGTVITT